MATIFGHALSAVTLSFVAGKKTRDWLFVRTMIYLSIAPDLDVFGLLIGIPYESFWGHRGFTHSIFFGVLLGTTVSFLINIKRKRRGREFVLATFLLILATLSHSFFDGFTNGGHGIAFLAPFDNTRYFFPMRVLEVSPIGLWFFSARGLEVILSELVWIALPCLGGLCIYLCLQKFIGDKSKNDS